MNTNETNLLTRVKQSNLEAFRSLFEKYQPLLFDYLYYRLRDYDLTQDIIQETFLKVWLNRKTIKPKLSFWDYIIKISENLIKDHYKRLAVREKHKDYISTNPASLFDNPEIAHNFITLQQKINDVVNTSLPTKCRQIFILSRIEGKSNQDIACLLNISKRTVENQLYHALKILRKKLEKYI